jgi:lysophospholipase L1-like esterase
LVSLALGCNRGPAPGTTPSDATPHPAAHWVATWGASPQRATKSLEVSGQTVREIVRVSLGGARLRVRLSNAFGSSPVSLGAAAVAPHTSGPSVGPGRPLLFGGAPSVTIPAGGVVASDPVDLPIPALAELAVSLYIPGAAALETEHASAHQTTYVSGPGDLTGAPTLTEPKKTASWYLLAAVDVERTDGSAVVVIGDSLTDGDRSTRDANHRWTDRLAERLEPLSIAVVNEGLSGNRLLHDHPEFGKSALSRFDADVLDQPGVKYVVVEEGVNDIGLPGAFHVPSEVVSAEAIIEAHRRLVERAHARGLRIFGATMGPYEGVAFEGYYTPEGDAKRAAVNAWIRTGGAYDAVIDLDAVLRDPDHPSRLRPALSSDDHIHPIDEGYRAMADAVDLAIFAERPRLPR